MNCPCCNFPECDHWMCRGMHYDPDENCPCCNHPRCDMHTPEDNLPKQVLCSRVVRALNAFSDLTDYEKQLFLQNFEITEKSE